MIQKPHQCVKPIDMTDKATMTTVETLANDENEPARLVQYQVWDMCDKFK